MVVWWHVVRVTDVWFSLLLCFCLVWNAVRWEMTRTPARDLRFIRRGQSSSGVRSRLRFQDGFVCKTTTTRLMFSSPSFSPPCRCMSRNSLTAIHDRRWPSCLFVMFTSFGACWRAGSERLVYGRVNIDAIVFS